VSRRALLLAALASGACGPDNGLSGSVSEVFPLDVSRVEVARNAEALQVTYFLNRGLFLDVVARVSVLVEDVVVKPGLELALAGASDAGVLRCVVVHAPGGEPVRTLPLVKRGQLDLSQGGQAGELTRGSFSIAFEQTGGDLGGGRTLDGTFLGLATDAGFGPLP
jgi:hypothetical protein